METIISVPVALFDFRLTQGRAYEILPTSNIKNYKAMQSVTFKKVNVWSSVLCHRITWTAE